MQVMHGSYVPLIEAESLGVCSMLTPTHCTQFKTMPSPPVRVSTRNAESARPTPEEDEVRTILGADRSCGVHRRTAEVNDVHFTWDGSRRSPLGPNTELSRGVKNPHLQRSGGFRTNFARGGDVEVERSLHGARKSPLGDNVSEPSSTVDSIFH